MDKHKALQEYKKAMRKYETAENRHSQPVFSIPSVKEKSFNEYISKPFEPYIFSNIDFSMMGQAEDCVSETVNSSKLNSSKERPKNNQGLWDKFNETTSVENAPRIKTSSRLNHVEDMLGNWTAIGGLQPSETRGVTGYSTSAIRKKAKRCEW